MKRTIGWVIEEGMFSEEYQAAMQAACEKLFILPLSGRQSKQELADNIFHGSIETACQVIGSHSPCIGWCHWDNFTPSTVLAHWGEAMLNEDAVFVPAEELRRRLKSLRWCVGGSTGLFVRIDSSLKGDPEFKVVEVNPFTLSLCASLTD